MKKSFLLINVLLCIAVMIADFYYMTVGTIAIKSLASGLFVLTGLVNLVYCLINKTPKIFPIIIVVALIFAMLGDIFLEINFIFGAAIFAVGHIIFIVAYCFRQKFKWTDLIYIAGVMIPAILIILFLPSLKFDDIVLKILCLVYAIVISTMVGKALANFVRERNFLNFNLLLGAVLFFVSDLMLLLARFAQVPNAIVICLLTYYPALFLLGFALYHFADEKHQEQA